MNPLQAAQQALEKLNPIPQPLRVLIGSSWFWLAIWVALCVGVVRYLFGEKLGAWIGLTLAALSWWTFVPSGRDELNIAVVVFVLTQLIGSIWSSASFTAGARGVKICPDCAEEIKSRARVCKHCGFEFQKKDQQKNAL
jgi:Uncharacterised protein family UPF0547